MLNGAYILHQTSNNLHPITIAEQSVRNVKWYKSFVFKYVLIFITIFLFIMVSIVGGQHYFKRKQIAEQFGTTLKTIVQNYAPQIGGDDLKRIRIQEDAKSSEFKRIRTILAQARELNDLDEDLVYILGPSKKVEGQWYFQVMLQEQTFIGDVYTPPKHLKVVYEKALKGQPAYSKIFSDEHGSFISAVAPIKNSKGDVVALLEADYRLQKYLDQIRSSLLEDYWMLGVAFLIILIVGIWMYFRLNSLVEGLLAGTKAIEDQDYDYRIKIDSDDELSRLASAINHVLKRLKERNEMMRFLPTHTQKMIKRVLKEEGTQRVLLSEARDVDVVVLESDIRGFTALSENLSPAETITLINKYIELQATFLMNYGGSIDKYMGDAVLVVFEGERADYRALACARDILHAVEALNQEIENSIQIGIGISSGHVVMGNMGCEARMEHTVIGPTVNLAARLCSAAKGGEIVAQRRVVDISKKLDHSLYESFQATEEITVKGFSQQVSVKRVHQSKLPFNNNE